MGANIKQSVCSVCANEASTPDEFCDHIKKKGLTFEVTSAEGEKIRKKAYEDCIGVDFFEISFVFDPADETALLLPKEAAAVKEASVPEWFSTAAQAAGLVGGMGAGAATLLAGSGLGWYWDQYRQRYGENPKPIPLVVESLKDFVNYQGSPGEVIDTIRQKSIGSMDKHSPGKEHMKGVSPKRNRQYEHVLESLRKEHPDWSEEKCKEVAARTVNKERAEKGETKGSKVANGMCQTCGHD
jgi:hypothetical protein